MKKNQKSLFLRTITVLFICSFFAINCFSQGQSQLKKEEKAALNGALPKGNWSISISPYQTDYFSPIYLFSVSSNQARAERFDIVNISNKSVKAIKVSWLVYQDENRNKIVKQGTTQLLNFRKELLSGQRGFIKFPVVGLNDFYRSFLAENRLNGDFIIDLRVEDVRFSDDSIWQRQDGLSPDIKSELAPQSEMLDCAKQKCKGTPSTEVIGGVTYSCEASTLNERCATNGNYSCSNQSCNQPGGDGGGGGGGIEQIEIIP